MKAARPPEKADAGSVSRRVDSISSSTVSPPTNTRLVSTTGFDATPRPPAPCSNSWPRTKLLRAATSDRYAFKVRDLPEGGVDVDIAGCGIQVATYGTVGRARISRRVAMVR